MDGELSPEAESCRNVTDGVKLVGMFCNKNRGAAHQDPVLYGAEGP